jgi:hypothetical protein
MTPIRTFAIASPPAPHGARRDFARVEKISLSNRLNGERGNHSAQESFAAAKLARAGAFQNETAGGLPEEDGQRLVPTFVTQVLAQFTAPSNPDVASALLAYRNGRSQVAPGYDRNI